jgi:hypothetical protein
VEIFLLKMQYELPCLQDAETATATVSTVVLLYCCSRAPYSDIEETVHLTRVESH